MPETDFQQLALGPTPFAQLPPEAQAIRSGQTLAPAPMPNGLTVPLPERISATDLSAAIVSPTVPEDVRKLIGELQGQQLKIAELFKPSPRERQLQTEIAGLQTGAELGLAKIGEQAIPMPLILGQQAALERQAQARIAGPQRQLGIEQQARLGELQGQQFIQTQTQQNLNTIISLANQLSDNARNTLSTVLTNFGGLAFEDLDPGTKSQLEQLARNTGLPSNLLKAGMRTIKERQLEQRATQVQTEITDVGNRRVLVNRQTGEIIKDLGVRPVTAESVVDVRQRKEALAGLLAQVGTYKDRKKSLEELDKFKESIIAQVGQEGLDQIQAAIDRRFPPPKTEQPKPSEVKVGPTSTGLFGTVKSFFGNLFKR